MRPMRRYAATVAACAVALLATLLVGRPAAGDEPEIAERLGDELCLQCHAAYAQSWATVRHSAYMQSERLPESRRGCEGCHGPGSLHVTDENFLKIKNPNRLRGLAAVEMCLACHKTEIRPEGWLATGHAQADLNCGACHEGHDDTGHPSLLYQPINDTCLSCHPDQEAEFRFNSHHPVLEGRMVCTDCHNPHQAGPTVGGLQKSGDDRCLKCHQEKQGPFVFEHQTSLDGTQTGCLECHQPHGSPNPKLSTYFGRGVCLQCHTDIAADVTHATRPGNCWRSGCHNRFHGSNSNRLFIN